MFFPPKKILDALMIVLGTFILANFLLFVFTGPNDVGVDSQWLYNVYLGGSGGVATYWYEEKIWVESITYCEKIFCSVVMKTNPTHFHTSYVTGDNHLVKSTIIDKEYGTTYEISYSPPLLLRPESLSVGDTWRGNTVVKVRTTAGELVREESHTISGVESKVVDRLVLSGSRGTVEAFLIEEWTRGVLTRRSVYSPALHQEIRYEIPVSMAWGELVDVSLRQPSVFDFFRIRMFLGLELAHVFVAFLVLAFLRLAKSMGLIVSEERKNTP